jgi:predicted Holliday junction resolvase-like endonuclease
VTIALFLVGLVIGLLVGWRLLQRWRASAVERRVEAWRTAESQKIAAEARERSEAVLTGKIGEQFAPFWLEFPFRPTDVRFLGSPIDFVVFDGATDVRLGRATALRRVVFVDIKTGRARLTPVQRRIKDCVEGGRVRFQEILVSNKATS